VPRPRARAVLGRAVKSAAAAADRVRPAAPGVVVLCYHRVGARSGLAVDLPTALFDEQMATLARSGRVTTIDAALAALADEHKPGKASEAAGDPVVVTFDDGTSDFVDTALPVLARHGIPALLYVATDFIDSGRPFPNDGQPLSWAALSDATSTGLVTVGSHTHTHALLDRLADRAVHDELDRSIACISERLGAEPAHFAYPKAVAPSPIADRAVRARFRSAALAGTRPNPYGHTDPYRLARSPIQTADGMRWFRQKLSGGMALEDALRRVANRARYAGATT
jgi:peptidoglycan/xylan/chitin deacetylase (PgdA/CDA1 family)